MNRLIRFSSLPLAVLCVCFGIPFFAPIWVTLGAILLLLLFIFLLIVNMNYWEDNP